MEEIKDEEMEVRGFISLITKKGGDFFDFRLKNAPI